MSKQGCIEINGAPGCPADNSQLMCGPMDKDPQTWGIKQCIPKGSSSHDKRYNQLLGLDQYVQGNGQFGALESISNPGVIQQHIPGSSRKASLFDSGPSIFGEPKIFNINLARRNLFDDLSTFRPNPYIPDNVDIFSALKGNMFDNVYKFVQTRANLNTRDRAGNTPLITALLDDNDRAAALLITKGASVNVSNNAGLTPLMAAASNNNELLVDILLKKGANTKATTVNGMIAEDFTTDPGIKILLQKKGHSSRHHKRSSSHKRKACKAGQVRSRSTGRCRKK